MVFGVELNLLTIYLWASSWTSLCLSFHNCKWEVIIVCVSESCEHSGDSERKGLSAVPGLRVPHTCEGIICSCCLQAGSKSDSWTETHWLDFCPINSIVLKNTIWSACTDLESLPASVAASNCQPVIFPTCSWAPGCRMTRMLPSDPPGIRSWAENIQCVSLLLLTQHVSPRLTLWSPSPGRSPSAGEA